jgi:hypothetical protein
MGVRSCVLVCVPARELCVRARGRAVCVCPRARCVRLPSFFRPFLSLSYARPCTSLSLSLTQMQINDAAAMEQQMKMGGAGPQVVI